MSHLTMQCADAAGPAEELTEYQGAYAKLQDIQLGNSSIWEYCTARLVRDGGRSI